MKNVLGCRSISWPEIPETRGSEYLNSLQKILIPLKYKLPSLPWREIRLLNKDSRSKAKKEFYSTLSSKKDYKQYQHARTFITVGMNSTLRSMERREIILVLFDSQIDGILRNLIGSLACTNSIPAVFIPGLKNSLFECMGFKSSCLGFKTSVEELENIFIGFTDFLKSICEYRISPKQDDVVVGVSDKQEGGNVEGTNADASRQPGEVNLNYVHIKRRKLNERTIRFPNTTKKSSDEFVSVSGHVVNQSYLNKRDFGRYTDD